jgi:hypothetical protein
MVDDVDQRPGAGQLPAEQIGSARGRLHAQTVVCLQHHQRQVCPGDLARLDGDQIKDVCTATGRQQALLYLRGRLQPALAAVRLLVQPRVLDGDRRGAGECDDSVLVLVGEVPATLLLGEVEVAEDTAPAAYGDSQERVHRWVVRRKAVGLRMLLELVQPQRPRVGDQQPEDAVPSRQSSDRRALLVVDSPGDEVAQLFSGGVEDSQGDVARTGQPSCRGDHPLQRGVQLEIPTDGNHSVEQSHRSLFAGRRRRAPAEHSVGGSPVVMASRLVPLRGRRCHHRQVLGPAVTRPQTLGIALAGAQADHVGAYVSPPLNEEEPCRTSDQASSSWESTAHLWAAPP